MLTLQGLYLLCLRSSLLRYLFLLALLLHQSTCNGVEFLVLFSKLSLHFIHLCFDALNLLFLLGHLPSKLSYLVIEISLQVSNLGLRLLCLDIECIDLSVSLNYLLLQVANLFLVVLPNVADLLQMILLQLFGLNAFEGQFVECLDFALSLRVDCVLELPQMPAQLLKLSRACLVVDLEV